MSSATPDRERPVTEGGPDPAADPGPDPGPVPADPSADPDPGPAPAVPAADVTGWPAVVTGWPAVDPVGPAIGPAIGPAARGGRGRVLGTGLIAALVMALLGVPLGLLWTALAPSVPVVRTDDGTVLAQPQPEEFIAADGWFSLLGLGFGVLAAIAVWLLLRRHRGPAGLLLLVAGGLAAAVVAWQVGRRVGLADYRELLRSAPMGHTFAKPPDLRAGGFEWLYGFVPTLQGDLLLPAFGAVIMYTLLAGWSKYTTLRPETEPPALSWDSPAPPAPGAEPAPPVPGAAEPPRD